MVHDILKMIDQGLVVPAIAISGTLVFFLAFLIIGPVIFYYNFRLKQYLRKNSPELWEMYSSTSGKIRRKCGRLLGESEDPIIRVLSAGVKKLDFFKNVEFGNPAVNDGMVTAASS